MNFWRQLAGHLESGERAFVAVVADHTRHSPGTRGARMFVRPDGSQEGTIGGGVMEADTLERAALALAARSSFSDSEILEHKRETGPSANPSGLICAGRQTMVYWLAEATHADVYRDFAERSEDDREAELVVAGGAPSIRTSGVEATRAPVGWEDGPPVVFREHSINRHRVAVVGGGHCGVALCRVMSQLGYRTTNIEVRADVFTFENNEWADRRIVVEDFREAAGVVSFPELTHFVVMTSAMPSDVEALQGAVGYDFPYVGVMGSSAKLKAIRSALSERGVSVEGFRNFYAPVGLEMTSNTPEEIAISIAAQILRERERLFPWTRPASLGD